MVVIHLVLALLWWTVCYCPLNLGGSEILLYELSSWWQRCHQQTSSTLNGGLVMSIRLSIQNSPYRDETLMKPYITVPYYKGWSESVKKKCFKFTLEEVQPSKTTWWPQRTKILCWRRVGSSIVTDVVGWSVMRNIQESPQEHLVRGSRNTKRPPPPYVTILTPLVTA